VGEISVGGISVVEISVVEISVGEISCGQYGSTPTEAFVERNRQKRNLF
jgi:hypothetical protein